MEGYKLRMVEQTGIVLNEPLNSALGLTNAKVFLRISQPQQSGFLKIDQPPLSQFSEFLGVLPKEGSVT